MRCNDDAMSKEADRLTKMWVERPSDPDPIRSADSACPRKMIRLKLIGLQRLSHCFWAHKRLAPRVLPSWWWVIRPRHVFGPPSHGLLGPQEFMIVGPRHLADACCVPHLGSRAQIVTKQGSCNKIRKPVSLHMAFQFVLTRQKRLRLFSEAIFAR